MRTATIARIVLVVFGIASLAYQGITYMTQKKVIDMGSLHATRDDRHTILLPPALGGLSLLGGAILLASGFKAAAIR